MSFPNRSANGLVAEVLSEFLHEFGGHAALAELLPGGYAGFLDGLELFGRVGEDLDALLLHEIHVLLVFGLSGVDGLKREVLRGFLEYLLLLGGELLPGLFADHEREVLHRVVRGVPVLDDVAEARVDGRGSHTVDGVADAGLEGLVNVSPRNGDGAEAHRLSAEHVGVHVRDAGEDALVDFRVEGFFEGLRGADADHAFDIGAEDADAEGGAEFVKLVREPRAGGENFLRLIVAVDVAVDVDEFEARVEGAGERRYRHIDGATDELFHDERVVAELAGGINFDFDVAVGLIRDFLREILHHLRALVLHRLLARETEYDLIRREGRRRHHCENKDGRHKYCQLFHCLVPLPSDSCFYNYGPPGPQKPAQKTYRKITEQFY